MSIDEKLEQRFKLLAEEWEAETLCMSNPYQMLRCDSYKEIAQLAGMHKNAIVKLILQRIKKGPWCEALWEIIEDKPAFKEADRGRVLKTQKVWLKWGKEKGFIDEI